jgi:hypothetical protein
MWVFFRVVVFNAFRVLLLELVVEVYSEKTTGPVVVMIVW